MVPRPPGPPPPPLPAYRPVGSSRPRDPLPVVLGLILVVPAGVVALVSLVVPTGQTIVRSFQRANLLSDAEVAGLDNYGRLLGSGEFWNALGFSLLLAVIPLVVAVVVAPLLAAALDHGGTWPRRVGRVLMSVPLVTFSPVAVAASWLAGQRGDGIATVFGSFADRDTARWTVALVTGAATFGVVCGLALLVFLAVLRGRRAGRPVAPVMAAVGAIVALATVAVSLQAFALIFTMTRGGPARSTQTLGILQFTSTFMRFELGKGAAVATVTGLLLAVLGVIATSIAITAALRIELTPRDRETTNPGRVLLAAAALLVVLVIAVIGAWPHLSALLSGPEAAEPSQPLATARTYVNTWVPPFLGALVSVGAAYLAALGIGGLRPLGHRSEWLLLPFAPWLFVGIGPLSIVGFENANTLNTTGTFVGLIPPIALSVPVLVVLTLFCGGQSARWHALKAAGAPPAATFVRVVAAPALPLAALLGGALVMINAQALLWPLVVGTRRENWTAPVVLAQTIAEFSTRGAPVGIVTPLVMLVVALLALAVLQVLYLDRLAIISHRTAPASEAPAAPGPPPWPAPGYRPAPPPPGPAPKPGTVIRAGNIHGPVTAH